MRPEKVARDAGVEYGRIEYLHKRDRSAALQVIACVRALERDSPVAAVLRWIERRAKK